MDHTSGAQGRRVAVLGVVLCLPILGLAGTDGSDSAGASVTEDSTASTGQGTDRRVATRLTRMRRWPRRAGPPV